MKTVKIWGGAAVLAALALGLVAVCRGRGDDAEDKENMQKAALAKEPVLKLVGAIESGAKDEDVKKQAADVGKKYDIKHVMWQMKPRDKGGLGVGPTPDAIQPDAIELKLIALGNPKKVISQKDLTAQQGDLVKMVEVSEAIAAVAPSYAANEGRKPAEQKKWNEYCEDMHKGSKELIDAIKGGDPKKVQVVADKLNASCNSCHTDFRDK
jgi:hypothetical protein